MKGSEQFKKTILKYLNEKSETDSLFFEMFNKPGKNIDDCVTYILNTVEKSGCSGFEDDEIYSMAIHYYNEDEIEVGAKKDMNVVVNHTVILTEEEQNEARQNAIKQAQKDAYRKMHQSKPTSKPKVENNQQTLI